MPVKIMGIEMTNDDYMHVNRVIVDTYGDSWNKYKYNDKIEIIQDILTYINN